jgi:hypothetical protein
MSLSWNEVRDRAIRFSREWSASTDEERDKQSFWNAFFDVFGVPRRSVATSSLSTKVSPSPSPPPPLSPSAGVSPKANPPPPRQHHNYRRIYAHPCRVL